MDFLKLEDIINVLTAKNYHIFTRKKELNVIGIRTKDTDANIFNDYRIIFWKNEQQNWEQVVHNITTDPGLFYRKHPINVIGTAVLKEGQIFSGWQLGKHKGKEAWVQKSYVTVIRDFNKNSHIDILYPQDLIVYKKRSIIDAYQTVEYLDGNNNVIYREQTGFFGINHHRAGLNSINVDKWSAGCQVTSQDKQHKEFIKLTKEYISLYNDALTYTLINEKDFI